MVTGVQRRRAVLLLRLSSVGVAFLLSGCLSGATTVASGELGTRAGSGPFLALWPEHTRAAANRAQILADAGDPAYTWRTHAVPTAAHFIEAVMGWKRFQVGPPDFWHVEGRENVRIPICRSGGCPSKGPTFDEQVRLSRVVRSGEGGIWSVTQVQGARLMFDSLGMQVGLQRTRAGRVEGGFTSKAGDGGLPEGTRIQVGSVVWSPCGRLVDAEPMRIWLREVRFQVAPHAYGDGTCHPSPLSLAVEPSVLTPTGFDASLKPLTRPSPGVVFLALPENDFQSARSMAQTLVRHSGPAVGLEELSAMAVDFLPRTGRMPKRPAPWWMRNPRALPACGQSRIRFEKIGAEHVMGGMLLMAVQIRTQPVAACRLHIRVRLELLNETGKHLLGVKGNPAAVPLKAFLPRRFTAATWMWNNWCRGDRRLRARIQVVGSLGSGKVESLAKHPLCVAPRHGSTLSSFRLSR